MWKLISKKVKTMFCGNEKHIVTLVLKDNDDYVFNNKADIYITESAFRLLNDVIPKDILSTARGLQENEVIFIFTNVNGIIHSGVVKDKYIGIVEELFHLFHGYDYALQSLLLPFTNKNLEMTIKRIKGNIMEENNNYDYKIINPF